MVCVYVCVRTCVSVYAYTCMCPCMCIYTLYVSRLVMCAGMLFYHKHMGYWLKCKFIFFTPDLETFSATTVQAACTAQLKNHHPQVPRKRLWVVVEIGA